MSRNTALILSILFTALMLVPAGAHLMSLPNKIGMNAQDYLAAQQAYAGWNLSGIVVITALITTFWLGWMCRHDATLRGFVFVALACIVLTQVVFWTLNFPGNAATSNWTQLPDNWETLRSRWELGHALAAVLTLLAFLSLLTATWRLLKR
jgi:hypothetical protein